ncbi:MAG: Transcriptional regulator [Clostridiales bacterium 38_11]|nr:MAG: Transcriptional regulator [Clostridiales bacterium 38_11]
MYNGIKLVSVNKYLQIYACQGEINLLIREIMMKNPIIIYENESLLDVSEKIKKYSVDSFPVLNVHNEPIGILTERSLIMIKDFSGQTVNDIMKPVDEQCIVKEFEETNTIFNKSFELFFVVDDLGKFKSLIRKRHVMKMHYEKLEYSFFKHKSLMACIDSGVLLLNRVGDIVEANDRVEEIFHSNPNDIIGLNISELIDHYDITGIKAADKESYSTVLNLRNKKIILYKEPILRKNYYIGCVLTARDISEYNRIEEQLTSEKTEKEILKTIFDMAYDGLIVVDSEGYIKMISNAYKKFLGLEKEKLVGKHVTEVIENTRLHIVAKTGVSEIGDLQKIKGDYIIASRIPVFENGKVTNVVGKVMFRNIGELDELYNKITKIEQQLENYRDEITQMNRAQYRFSNIVGKSNAIKQSISMAKKSAYTDSNVLILGESGTGKELFAQSIHNSSARRGNAFIKVNCAAIPDDLLESELFGYEEGSFTGAKRGGKIGKFEAADQGTIFLDEIGDMPLNMQAKLLRTIQEREIERIGSTQIKKIDVRIIAATNRNIQQMIEAKKFRLDLYYRLNVVTLRIPALRERTEDIEELSKNFIEKFRVRYLKKIETISESAIMKLKRYNWPGNVRELENIIERAINIMDEGSVIKPKHLPLDITSSYDFEEFKTLKEIVEETEKKAILNCLEAVNYNKSKASRILGISRTAFYEKIDKYGLEV